MSQSRPGWSARRVSQPGYLVTTVLVALTGLVLAARERLVVGGFLLQRLRPRDDGLLHPRQAPPASELTIEPTSCEAALDLRDPLAHPA
jgi:hypothetical protein